MIYVAGVLFALIFGFVAGWKLAIRGVCSALDAGRLDELVKHIRKGHLS